MDTSPTLPKGAERADLCAAMLLRATRSGERIGPLPSGIAPSTRAEAYVVQTRIADLGGHATAGWKIAATSAAGQRHINVDGPIGGRVFADRVHADGTALSLRGNAMRLAEPEFVFVLGSPILPRVRPYTAAEVMDAVSELRFGIELPSTRFTDVTAVGANQLIADNACGHQFVLGPETLRPWTASELASVDMTATINGPATSRSVKGTGANVLGDPVAALTWLANELTYIGTPLEASAFVTTGTCSAPIAVQPGDRLAAHFQGFMTVTCAFVP
ncbi:2-keto-4-pentenoate hydratase [Streptomyces dysideae]|uniref:Fumarylacetoacetase-like C-terminal domain-containing protein n=1 Tax=Streptomyces dysideae TaxID=909626 RepID=A0A101UT76_9ACTN|nr:fumarylacetoacetate hydrolase family protein [Streptomyces dysideae]KUO16403.1 hypothetical protein AQJ91_35970 [Streptomyces dysideae]